MLKAVADHLRSVLVLDAKALSEERTRSLVQRVAQMLREPWTFEERERLRQGKVALLPGVSPDSGIGRLALRLGAASAIGRYLRSRRTWNLERDLSFEEVEQLVGSIVAALRGHLLTVVDRRRRAIRSAAHDQCAPMVPG